MAVLYARKSRTVVESLALKEVLGSNNQPGDSSSCCLNAVSSKVVMIHIVVFLL